MSACSDWESGITTSDWESGATIYEEYKQSVQSMTDCFSGTALKETVNRLQNELLKEDKKLGTLITTEDGSEGVWITKDGYVLGIDMSKHCSSELIIEYQYRDSEKQNLENDIAYLKKKIKHSKHPMEKKHFEKQLNLAYKRRKLDKGGTSSWLAQ